MTSGFTAARAGSVLARFGVVEAMLLRSLAAQLVELLADDQPGAARQIDPLASLLDFQGPVDRPADPVLARLLPDAYRDDEEAAADFRRYTEQGLREGKVRNACVVIDTLEAGGLPSDDETLEEPQSGDDAVEALLDPDAASAWLRCLTDLRLALATRLGVEADDEERWQRLPDEDPRAQMYDVYGWLGYLQETLVQALPRTG
jgi:Domain of unknown function (DUF2017)